jgi:hypothetical protein
MHEIGPAMLLYTGQVIYFGAANSKGHGKTALYTPPSPIYRRPVLHAGWRTARSVETDHREC